MKEIRRKIVITNYELEKVKKILTTDPASRERCIEPDKTKIYRAYFPGDMRMDVTVCGTGHDNGSGFPYTKAELFMRPDLKIAETDPDNRLLGEWKIGCGNMAYIVDVMVDPESMSVIDEIHRPIVIPKNKAKEITRILNTKPVNEEGCFGEDETMAYTADFGNGIQMDVRICGVRYKEGECNRPYTEAVLFKNDYELCRTNPDSDFFGKWDLIYDNVRYIADITVESESPHTVTVKNVSTPILPVEMYRHIRDGGRVFLVGELSPGRVIISVSEYPDGKSCTVVDMADIE